MELFARDGQLAWVASRKGCTGNGSNSGSRASGGEALNRPSSSWVGSIQVWASRFSSLVLGETFYLLFFYVSSPCPAVCKVSTVSVCLYAPHPHPNCQSPSDQLDVHRTNADLHSRHSAIYLLDESNSVRHHLVKRSALPLYRATHDWLPLSQAWPARCWRQQRRASATCCYCKASCYYPPGACRLIPGSRHPLSKPAPLTVCIAIQEARTRRQSRGNQALSKAPDDQNSEASVLS